MANKSKPLVELFLKSAPTDKNEKGPCLIGQQWFMTLYGLVERGLIDLRLTPMSLDQPPKNYSALNAARHLPIAWIEAGNLSGNSVVGLVISTPESLERLMQQLGCPNLDPAISKAGVLLAEEVFRDLYTKFTNFLQNDNVKPLLKVLHSLDQFLASKSQHYLLGPDLCYADCQLMPKLQHIRVAGRCYKQFDIPQNLSHLWCYIHQMYKTRSFICTCPSDRDILLHYSDKYSLPTDCRLHLMGPECLSELPSFANSNKVISDTSL